MQKLNILCVALVMLSTNAAFGRGGGMGGGMHGGMGMGGSHMSVTGGAFGTSAAAPGTNSLGTALATTGTGRPQNDSLLGTSPAIDRDQAKVDKMINSICRGC